MNFISAAERIASIDRSEIVLDAKRCLHAHDQFSNCEACIAICPAGAIQSGKPPTLDAKRCKSCLACLPVCPVGAYSADDAVPPLLNCVARLETKSIELICELHERADTGVSSESSGVRVRGCLSGLGVGTLLALTAMGLERIFLRLDSCEKCPWKSLQGVINLQVKLAGQLLRCWGKGETVICIPKLDEGVERPLWDADNPPLSRRDLFRRVALQGQVAMARAMSMHSPGNKRQPGRDRLRLISAVSHLPEPDLLMDLPLSDDGFAIISVSEACTACATCARACPTAALSFGLNDRKTYYWLNFIPQACIGCEVCVHVCEPEAIEANKISSFTQIFGEATPSVVSEGDLTQCVICKTEFSTRSGQKYCPVCEYRRKSPFGSKLPPGLKVYLHQRSSSHDS